MNGITVGESGCPLPLPRTESWLLRSKGALKRSPKTYSQAGTPEPLWACWFPKVSFVVPKLSTGKLALLRIVIDSVSSTPGSP